MPEAPTWVSAPAAGERIRQAGRVDLFLDYDGTLAGFAPTPDDIQVDEQVVRLLRELAAKPRLRVAVVSGRRLRHVRALLPVEGIWLAGTYGVELVTPGGEQLERVAFSAVRPVLERLKPRWEALIAGRDGFYLEDKGWALAIHASRADDRLAGQVLAEAAAAAIAAAAEMPAAQGQAGAAFCLLGGRKFQEIGPGCADKGQAVEYILENYPLPGALPVFIGDDDKDEPAFTAVQRRGGLAGLVAAAPRPSQANFRLESPAEVRRWLRETFLDEGYGSRPSGPADHDRGMQT